MPSQLWRTHALHRSYPLRRYTLLLSVEMQVAGRSVDAPNLVRCSVKYRAQMVHFSIVKVSAVLDSGSTPLLIHTKTWYSESLRRRRWKRKMSAAERRKGGMQYTVEGNRQLAIVYRRRGGFSSWCNRNIVTTTAANGLGTRGLTALPVTPTCSTKNR